MSAPLSPSPSPPPPPPPPAVHAEVTALDDVDMRKHRQLSAEWGSDATWPKHLVVRYRWSSRHEEDEQRGLLVLFAGVKGGGGWSGWVGAGAWGGG